MSEIIHDVDLEKALGERYLSYALSTIISRSLPDVRDGLKPVHRRLIYAMQQLRLNPNSPFKKSARIVGDVMGKFHPHGDVAIYDALVRLAQDFSVRYPLIEGQGNFGNIDGDNAAAMRYTESRLTPLAALLMEGIDENSIDFRPTYDGESHEPIVFPAAFPNLLANGATGIAVGMATSIPPHNLGELCQALHHLIETPHLETRDLLQFIGGPDFPTGGIVVESQEALIKAYETGRGHFRLRAKWDVEPQKSGAYAIVITEIPFHVSKSKLIEKMAMLLREKKLPLLQDISEESADDIRLVLEPKSRHVDPHVLMESLFRQTDLEVRIPLNMNVLDGGRIPKVMSLKDVLLKYLDHRKTVLIRRTEYRLSQISERLELLQGYLIAYLNINEVIHIIQDEEDPKSFMKEKFALSEGQVEAILNMRLRALRKLQEIEIQKEHDQLTKEQEKLKNVLLTPSLQWNQIKSDLRQLEKTYGEKTLFGKRRTLIKEPVDTPLIPFDAVLESQEVTIVCSKKGWIRTIKGHQIKREELKYKEGDEEKVILPAFTTDKLLILASNGRFYTLLVDKLSKTRGHGDSIRLIIDLPNTEEIVHLMIASHQLNQKYFLASSDSRGFLVEEKNLYAQTRSGKQVMTLGQNAKVIICLKVEDKHDLVLILGENRKLLAFPLIDLPTLSRGRGVTLQKYKQGEVADIKIIHASEGLQWERSGKICQEKTILPWQGRRGGVGRLVPMGFPRTNKFSKG